MLQKTKETDAFWDAYRRHAGIETTDYAVSSFGDTPEMADELCRLVLHGPKRATASLARDFGDTSEPLPRVGDFVVTVDGKDQPRFIWRTTDVEVKPLIEVDERFAWDEGEGDRSRGYWLSAHQDYFRREAERGGFEFHDRIDTVFERFEVVWPPEFADR
jgi:uncharacterized protein YhfF